VFPAVEILNGVICLSQNGGYDKTVGLFAPSRVGLQVTTALRYSTRFEGTRSIEHLKATLSLTKYINPRCVDFWSRGTVTSMMKMLILIRREDFDRSPHGLAAQATNVDLYF